MKKLLFILLTLMYVQLSAQGICEIIPGDTTVCYGSYLKLYTQYEDTLFYDWQPYGETSPLIEIPINKDSSWVYLNTYNLDSSFFCSDTVLITTYERIVIELEQPNKGCPRECKAQVIASATGGYPPYRFVWNALVAPNDSSTALGLCSEEDYLLTVYDTICASDTVYEVDAYSMPEIELTTSPSDSIYLVNPQVTFYYENLSIDSIELTNFAWIFPDGSSSIEPNPTHVMLESDTVFFDFTTFDGCDSNTYIHVEVIDSVPLFIPNVFTPNSDGVNDKYIIKNLDLYISNRMVIVNRWGQQVYETSNYNEANAWDGGNHPDGTYYYVLTCYGYFNEEIYKGVVTILGSPY